MSDSQQPLYLTALTPFCVIRSSQVHVPLSLTSSRDGRLRPRRGGVEVLVSRSMNQSGMTLYPIQESPYE